MNKITVKIINEQKIYKPNIKKLKEITQCILKKEGCKKTEVSILLTNDLRIKELNKRYRKINKTTDVLAFYQEKSRAKALKADLLGDVVISIETAKRQAKEYNKPLLKEIYLYLIHGLLHLLNYKDKSLKDYQTIKEKQEAFLDKIWKEEH